MLRNTFMMSMSLLLAQSALADEHCIEPSTVVGASYRIETSGGSARDITILRNTVGNVMYILDTEALTRIYQNYGKAGVAVIEYFDGESIGVEYEPSTQIAADGWDAIYQVFPESRLADLETTEADAYHCLASTHYGGPGLDITYLDSVKLPITVKQVSGDTTQYWTLTTLHTDRSVLDAKLAQVDGYTTYDFADLGDSENEPFFRNSEYLNYKLHGPDGHSH